MKLLLLNPPFIFGLFLLLAMLSTFLGWSDLFETIIIYSLSASFLMLIGLLFHYKLSYILLIKVLFFVILFIPVLFQ